MKREQKGGVVCFFVFDLLNPGQNQFGPQVFCLKGQRRFQGSWSKREIMLQILCSNEGVGY